MSHIPLSSSPSSDEPDFESLRRSGWTIGSVIGHYCMAWREAEEVVLLWRHGEWRQVAGRTPHRAAA